VRAVGASQQHVSSINSFCVGRTLPAMKAFPSPDDLKGTVQGTLLYLSLYIALFGFQSLSKFYLVNRLRNEARAKDGDAARISFRAVKYYNSKHLLALRGDRTVGNFVEQAVAFLPLLWLHALFVDPSISLHLAGIYTVSRSYYPLLFNSHWILCSTVPGYVVVGYMMFQVAFTFALVDA
jgi:hypothetical protein